MKTFNHRYCTSLLAVAMTAFVVAACGGSDDDDGNSSVRLINATADIESIDLTVDNDDIDERREIAGVARDGQSGYSGVGNDTYTIRMKRAGASSTLALNSATFEKDERYTVFAYGREGEYKIYAAIDDEDEPSSGQAKVRVFNAAPDAGSVDVYLTEEDTSLDDIVATSDNVAGATLGYYNTIDRGTYRLRVTGLNDKDDIRLDVSGLELADKARVTLVLQPGPGGVLVNTLVSQYRGSLAAVKNPYARARLVAGATANAGVTAQLGSTSLNVNLRSPSVGSYTLVPAGDAAVRLRVNSTTELSGSVALTAGGDYTVAVYGEATSPVWRVISDDNRPPANSERAKLRLLHMAYGADSLTLVKDYVSVANDVAYGNASSYGQVTNSSSARIEVTTPLSASPLFLEEEADLPSRSVFTVFMLSSGSATTGILRRER